MQRGRALEGERLQPQAFCSSAVVWRNVLAQGLLGVLSPSLKLCAFPENKPARVSKQCREELSIINWNHICKCVFKARELSQCPKSRLGNCLLRLVPLPFLWTKQPQQLWEKRKTHANKPTSLFIFFTLNIKKQSFFFKGWGKLEAFYVSILCSFCLLNRFLTNACSINPKLEILNF